jgi:hypothetical protein
MLSQMVLSLLSSHAIECEILFTNIQHITTFYIYST